MNQRDGEYLNFEERLSIAIESELSVGDFLHGTWPRGGAIKLPISGNGGRTFDYARQGHPGGEKVESIIAALETGRSALLFSDGMRAIASATEVVVKPGDLVFVHSSLYGGTLRYFNLLSEWGVRVNFVDLDSDDISDQIALHRPKLIVLESVTNPLLKVLDIPLLMKAAKDVGAFMIIDNTLPTSFCCIPLEIARANDYSNLMVAISITKGYTGGVLGGVVVTDSSELAESLYRYRQAKGGNASPNDVPLYYDGLKTMGLRMQRLCENTSALVKYFRDSAPAGVSVLHPSVCIDDRDPEKGSKLLDRAKRLLLRMPGILTLECSLDQNRYETLIRKLEGIFIRCNSFNGINPQLSESTKQSHAGVKNPDQKKNAGITSQLVRLSPGSINRPENLAAAVGKVLNDWNDNVL